MRFAFVWFALFLLAMSAGAPLVEAFEDCQVPCAAGTEDDCGDSECCSCCPAGRFVAAAATGPARALDDGSQPIIVLSSAPRDAEARGILHVPKPVLI